MRAPKDLLTIATFVLFLSTPVAVSAVPLVFSIGGNASTASIQNTVDVFRGALGDPNNGNTPGPLTSGRREINWDGGGATAPAVSANPLTAFLNIRGAFISTPGTGSIQAQPADLATQFNNPTYTTIFGTFSPVRLFSEIGSNITDVTFFIPGTNGLSPATITGFGAVFTDVDLANSTTLQFFAPGGGSLGTFFVPAGTVPNASLSFLGVAFTTETVARVRITSGNVAPGPNDGGTTDVVMMDDFIYAEPRAIPEPAALIIFVIGIVAVFASQRFRGAFEDCA